MKEESFVYVKLEYEEALQAKRDILNTQVNLLKIMQMTRRYRFLRLEELKMKEKLYKKLKELIASIRRIKTDLPKMQIPQIEKVDGQKEIKKKVKGAEDETYDDSLEIQLREIQKKLENIGA